MTRSGINDGRLKPSVPLIELSGPSPDGAFSAIPISILWSNIEFCTSDFEYQSDGCIRVYTSGIYRLEYLLVINAVIGSSWFTTIEYDARGAGSWVDSDSSIYSGSAHVTQYFTITGAITIFLNAQDYLRLKVQGIGGAGSLLNGGRLRITYIPSGGWNNNSGGKNINRGIRR
jgi:hypothetical protein